MNKIQLVIKENIFFLIFLSIIIAYGIYLDPNFITSIIDIPSIFQVIALIPIMQFMVTGNILPLYLLKSDSEYGKYFYYKNVSDSVLPAQLFSTITIFPILMVIADQPNYYLIGMIMALMLITNLYLNIFYVYFISQESNSIYNTQKSSLILNHQYSNSFYFSILTQINIVVMIIPINNLTKFENLIYFSKFSNRFISAFEPIGFICFIGTIIAVSIVSIFYKFRYKNSNYFYSTAIFLNLISSIFSVICFMYIITSESKDRFDLNIFTLIKSISLIQIISLIFVFIDKIKNKGSNEIYIKPVYYEKKYKYSFLYVIIILFIFLTSYTIAGIKMHHIIMLLIIVGIVNVISLRRKYAIERIIASKTLELEEKNAENEKLLLNILPSSIADRLKKGEGKIADYFENVSVLFADIVGFTKLSQTMSSIELVNKLNEIFSSFDKIAEKLKIEKIKTIGDCYMAVAGIPEKQENHAEVIIKMGIEMLNILKDFNEKYSMNLSIRIGINSGEVVAGVIGEHKFIYDLWGDAVNTASRMESHGIPGKIQVTKETYEIVNKTFQFEPRGIIEVKGKGKMETFTVKI